MERLKKNFVLALGLGVVVYLVLAVVSGLEDLRDALSGFDFFLIPAILGLVSLSYAVRFVRWAYYLNLLNVRVPLGANAAIFAAVLSMTISPGKLGGDQDVFGKDGAGRAPGTRPRSVDERAPMVRHGTRGQWALWPQLRSLVATAFPRSRGGVRSCARRALAPQIESAQVPL